MSLVHVAVGVIKSGESYFLTRRLANTHQGGKWEFPGGKVEAGESVYQALHRELEEEIAIDVLSCIPLVTIEHDYGDKQVKLEVFIVDNFANEPQAQEGQEQGWFSYSEMLELDFPKANVEILAAIEKL
ncbi:8-oxo-dGTP diphosphatase MutT [Thalassotalea sp. LPB0316]|uniref:8-oxo-dGTP diphosphatase MutT n=1 Tax=Thalassotalea sp. LPB0316 TaxID=2769490 RepID=UPI0018663D0D|nr:8-oxo-dGTP diphosphatase MutT [Thalassotalea sp. LPB0316]QOL25893.1 8-oxo-dGTP diphosphatase MutT [Thalassotalea sp. LPB0316]